jgi:hypothetical protein
MIAAPARQGISVADGGGAPSLSPEAGSVWPKMGADYPPIKSFAWEELHVSYEEQKVWFVPVSMPSITPVSTALFAPVLPVLVLRPMYNPYLKEEPMDFQDPCCDSGTTKLAISTSIFPKNPLVKIPP